MGESERQRGDGWVRRAATGGLLVAVVAAPEAASWSSLLDVARSFGLSGPWLALVPLVLGSAGLLAAVLALRDTLAGDSALGNRLLVAVYALGGAGLNLWFNAETKTVPAALFFAGASVSAVVLWERLLRALRRDELRRAGALAAPLPRFRPARWLVAPKETARALRLAVVEGVTDPAVAVALARDEEPPRPPRVPVASQRADEVEGLSKADSVRLALRELTSSEVERPAAGEVVAWLAVRGVQVQPSYVTDVIRRTGGRSPSMDRSGPADGLPPDATDVETDQQSTETEGRALRLAQ